MDEKIRQWKKLYREIYRVTIDGEVYVFRTLNIGEASKIQQYALDSKNEEIEKLMFGTVLFPELFNPEAVPIAIGDKLLEYITVKSKVISPEGVKELYDAGKAQIDLIDKSDFMQWKLTLIQIFPGYKLSDFDVMIPSDFFYLIALAEQLTGKQLFNSEAIDNIIASNPQPLPVEDVYQDPVNGEVNVNSNKFLSRNELELISADQSTKLLQEHWMKYKNKKR